jgi:hypothetical protein
MRQKIIATDTGQKRIRDATPGAKRVDPGVVAETLGAEATGPELKSTGSPVSLFQLRSELLDRLRSSGGRPALEGATRRVKIPVTEEQWHELENLAASLTDLGFVPSAGQVASVLIGLSLPSANSQTDRIRRELAVRTAAKRNAE